jgi:hypothetical protein
VVDSDAQSFEAFGRDFHVRDFHMAEIFIDTIRNLTYSSREFSEWPVRRVKAFR